MVILLAFNFEPELVQVHYILSHGALMKYLIYCIYVILVVASFSISFSLLLLFLFTGYCGISFVK